jgi:general secretion pathway protein N
MAKIALGENGVGVLLMSHLAMIGLVAGLLKHGQARCNMVVRALSPFRPSPGMAIKKSPVLWKLLMKRWLVTLAIILLALGAVVWFIPASWALPLLQSRLRGIRFEGLSGTLWEGRAEQVSIGNDPPLGSLTWTLSRRALLGDVRVGMYLHQPQLQLTAQAHRVSSGQIDLRDATLHMDMAMLGTQPWTRGQPQGQFDLQVPQARLQGVWPMQLDATGNWSQASIRTEQGDVPLGTLMLTMNGESGAIRGTLNDDGSSPVQTSGRLSLSPLGWDLQFRLVPRSEDPAVMRWLRSLGTPAADGTLELRYRGGLAQMAPKKT